MELIRPFGPWQNSNTINLAVTASSQTLTPARTGVGYQSIRIVNAGTQNVMLKFGVAGITASLTTDMPMLANSVEIFTLDNDVTTIAVIAAATGSTIYVTTGQGI